MPRYSVRAYFIYVDEYEVEAAEPEEARDLVEQWNAQPQEKTLRDPILDSRVTRTAENKFINHEETCVNELDADGCWIE